MHLYTREEQIERPPALCPPRKKRQKSFVFGEKERKEARQKKRKKKRERRSPLTVEFGYADCTGFSHVRVGVFAASSERLNQVLGYLLQSNAPHRPHCQCPAAFNATARQQAEKRRTPSLAQTQPYT